MIAWTCTENSSGLTSGKPSHSFKTFPSAVSNTVKGNSPFALYCSAIVSFNSCCLGESLFFFILGKSALTRTSSLSANFRKTSASKISLCIRMQGPHQSDPEKFNRICLCSFLASSFASFRSLCQSEKEKQTTANNKKSLVL